MENRTLQITLQNAKDLKKVNLLTKMDVYAVVSISGGDKKSRQKAKTPVDHDGDANPTWDFPMKFKVEEAALQQNCLVIDFKLVCQRALGDKEVGEVHVPIKELLETPAKGGAVGKKFVSYQVRKPSGKPKGQLSFSYQFGEEITTSAASSPTAAKVYGESSVSVFPVEVGPSLEYSPTEGTAPAAQVFGEYSVSSAYPVVGPSLEYSSTAGWYTSGQPYPTTAAAGGGGFYPPPGGYATGGALTAGGYPPPHYYGYPSPPPCYGYDQPLPPPACYGYPPQSGYYGYPPPPALQKNNIDRRYSL